MLTLLSLQNCLLGSLSAANIGLIFEIIQSFLCISYGGGVRTLSRYMASSERNIFRFIGKKLDWQVIFLPVFKHFVYKKENTYLLVADETVEGKSGKKSFGQDYFYSTILQKVIKSVCLFGFSLVEVESRKSYFMGFEQVLNTAADRARIAAQKAAKEAGKGKSKGRKKGTKNVSKAEKLAKEEAEIPAAFRAFKSFFVGLITSLSSILPELKVLYLVVDSAYGNLRYLNLAQEKGLYLVSKLRCEPALFFNYDGAKTDEKRKGRPTKYGEKVDTKALSSKYLVSTKIENGIIIQCYQYQAWNKEMSEILLNVVSVIATNPKTGKVFQAHFFSNDLLLSAEKMVEYYGLRFQIEFDFRDAKQLFGLHKLKNYHQNQMTNMFNLSFFSLLVARIWQKQWAEKLGNPALSLLDLKTIFKARWNLQNALKLAQNPLSPFLNPDFIANFVPQDLINLPNKHKNRTP